MSNASKETLLQKIEELRKELHSKIQHKTVDHHELMNQEVVQISKRLDDLILEYMHIKNNYR